MKDAPNGDEEPSDELDLPIVAKVKLTETQGDALVRSSSRGSNLVPETLIKRKKQESGG